jgi:hypothetical protein
VELRPTIPVQLDDLADEHRLAVEFDVDGRREFGESLAHIAAARDEARFIRPT